MPRLSERCVRVTRNSAGVAARPAAILDEIYGHLAPFLASCERWHAASRAVGILTTRPLVSPPAAVKDARCSVSPLVTAEKLLPSSKATDGTRRRALVFGRATPIGVALREWFLLCPALAASFAVVHAALRHEKCAS